MRLWSLHPQYLDRAGLLAAWREGLLAQKVLVGDTKGYHHHPQLRRFRAHGDPMGAIGAFLTALANDATRRGYRFSVEKILHPGDEVASIPVTAGQLDYEWLHLGAKLERRSEVDAARWRDSKPSPNPVFTLVAGGIEAWERPDWPAVTSPSAAPVLLPTPRLVDCSRLPTGRRRET